MCLRSLFFVALTCLGLTAFGQEPGPINDSKIMKAACDNDVLAIRALIRENPGCVQERDQDNRTALHYAAAHGAIEAMQVLLQNGAPIDAQTNEGLPPIDWTIDFPHLDAMKLLIKAGANLELKRTDSDDEVWPSGRNLGRRAYTVLQCCILGARPRSSSRP